MNATEIVTHVIYARSFRGSWALTDSEGQAVGHVSGRLGAFARAFVRRVKGPGNVDFRIL